MWLYQSHRVVWFGFFKIIFITKEPKLQQLLSCAEKLWIQDTPWTKVITSGTWCKVCVQVIIRAVFRPWEHNGKHLVLDYGSIYAGMWTPSGAAMSCCPPWVARTAQTKAAGLQEAGGSPQATTCRSTHGLLPKAVPWWCELQTKWPQGWCPRALVFLWGASWTQWALLTSSDITDPFLWPWMMLRDTVIPSLTSHFSFHH